MTINPRNVVKTSQNSSLYMSERASRIQRLSSFTLQSILLLITSVSMITVLFILVFIAKDALPFFQLRGFKEFFTSTAWYPASDPGQFGVLAIFLGSALVTVGAILVAVPIGISASITLSDILPFSVRQVVKPVIEILAAIPSVAFGFFALVIFAPVLQKNGGQLLGVATWIIGLPLLILVSLILSELILDKHKSTTYQIALFLLLFTASIFGLIQISSFLHGLEISSGRNALNVAIILGFMSLPTIVSVSEDALQAVGRELREGSYALGATRAETLFKVVIPAASSGIISAIILGTMRALGETMVVWMASGNSAHIPQPWFNLLEPVRTLTATIAGDMGEADQVTGSARYHVLFAMALALLIFSFVSNLVSEWLVNRSRKKLSGR
ncbi:MAG: phosphate ABC transporter permease subunit PstC [Candidatus Cloacimonetes bacterium]|nr:phosphate ABC transporter permease subunit PstC [Candidatus Cloacimonadota bacterium]